MEVSVLDDRKQPAYYGTSIEMRDNETFVIEYRDGVEEKTEVTTEEKPPDKEERAELYKYQNRLYELKLNSLKQTAE